MAAFPVHTVVLPEPPVLNGHGGVNQVFGDVLIVYPLGVLLCRQSDQLPVVPGVLVHVVHHAVFSHRELAQVHGSGLRDDDRLDIDGGEAAQDCPRTQPHKQQGAQHLKDAPAHMAAALLPLLLFSGLAGGVIPLPVIVVLVI